MQSGLPTQPAPLGYFHSHVGAWALLPYFVEWHKNGSHSDIDKNSIFWAYRTQSVNDKAASGIPALGTLNGPIADEIYVTANLAQPGTLTVTSGTLQKSFNLSAEAPTFRRRSWMAILPSSTSRRTTKTALL